MLCLSFLKIIHVVDYVTKISSKHWGASDWPWWRRLSGGSAWAENQRVSALHFTNKLRKTSLCYGVGLKKVQLGFKIVQWNELSVFLQHVPCGGRRMNKSLLMGKRNRMAQNCLIKYSKNGGLSQFHTNWLHLHLLLPMAVYKMIKLILSILTSATPSFSCVPLEKVIPTPIFMGHRHQWSSLVMLAKNFVPE